MRLYTTEKAFAKKINDINTIIRPIFKLIQQLFKNSSGILEAFEGIHFHVISGYTLG